MLRCCLSIMKIDRPIRLGTNKKMFSWSSSSSWAARTAAPLLLMGCCEEAIAGWCRVLAVPLVQRRHATVGCSRLRGKTESLSKWSESEAR